MPTIITRALAATAVLIGLVAVARTASPTFWQVSTQTDLLKGEVENLSIDSDGRLSLGPAAQLVHETTAPFLWTLVPGPDGSLYLGSGNEGKVFRVDPAGRASVLYDAPELEVHALAMASGGVLYAATSPDGKIYKIDPQGAATPFFDPDDKYIWALAFDQAGNLYAGTGEKGVIYKVAPDGKGQPFYRTKATHAVSMTFDRAGHLLVGTESPGKIFRIDPDGKAFVLLDSAFREIHALRFDGAGVLYAAAVNGKGGTDERPADRPPGEPARPSPLVPSVSTEITSIAIVDLSAPPPLATLVPRRDDRRSPKGAVYRIAPDGVWDILWDSPDDSPYDLAFEPSGGLLIGTGPKGKIYRVSGDPAKASLLARAGAQQVTMFGRDGTGRHYYATANPGKLFRLSSERADRGSYESEVRDAQTIATWGTISWRASTPGDSRLQISTRSGNTATPDDTWSAWSAVYTNPEGEPISSPKARYLQWRAILDGKAGAPVLTSVTAAYLPRNLRPIVEGITVHPAGAVFQKPFSTGELEIAGFDDPPERKGSASSSLPGGSAVPSPPAGPALGRRVYQKGLQTFAWKAEDENSDTLQYDVQYRREGETVWKILKRNLVDPILVWDTTSVPNGTYVIKVVVSDAVSNQPGTALTGETESTSFDIDNTPPTVNVHAVRRKAARTLLQFEIRDDQSPIQRVEYSVDAERWRQIYPRDGIADSRFEQFELTLDGDVSGRSIVIRAVDALNNVATARGELSPKSR